MDVDISGTVYRLSTDTLMAANLNTGDVISSEELNLLLSKDKLALYKRKAHNYISYKPRTVKQVIKYLANEGADEKESNEVISFLKDFGLLDDKRYAEMYIADLYLKRPMGRDMALRELLKRGVPKSSAVAAIAIYTKEQENEQMVRLMEKRGIKPPIKSKKNLEKEIRYFMSRGFSPLEVRKLLS
jgi:regulatory protein